jgi:hypothetical protein
MLDVTSIVLLLNFYRAVLSMWAYVNDATDDRQISGQN